MEQQRAGVWIRIAASEDARSLSQRVLQDLHATDIAQHIATATESHADATWAVMELKTESANLWAPGLDTLNLCTTLALNTLDDPVDLVREIWLTMLMGPVAFDFPSRAELISAVNIRCNMVRAARKTMLAFHTTEAERPEDCWRCDEDNGFVIRPEASLIDALTKATQPEVSGHVYSFSCYRASEYVIVLAIAQELARCNPELYDQLQTLWRRRPIRSGEFHDVFLREQGTMDAPLPARYFVPGDRTWFRNPDEASADASGFEGSWVMYLGGGLFSNFWKHDEPYTLERKCLEIYHWRHGLYFDAEGEQRIDEAKVAVLMQASLKNPLELAQIRAIMERYREPRGVYTHAGGCIDTTREFARWVCPATSDMVLPSA